MAQGWWGPFGVSPKATEVNEGPASPSAALSFSPAVTGDGLMWR